MREQVDTVKQCLRLGKGAELNPSGQVFGLARCWGQSACPASCQVRMRLLQGGQGGHTYIPYCFIERFESGLLIVMVDASVPVQHRHAFPLSGFAVASVHAVVGAVVPLAGEHIETLWW